MSDKTTAAKTATYRVKRPPETPADVLAVVQAFCALGPTFNADSPEMVVLLDANPMLERIGNR